VAKYDAFNAEGGHSYTLGANAFTDLTGDEFKARHVGGYTPSRREQRTGPTKLTGHLQGNALRGHAHTLASRCSAATGRSPTRARLVARRAAPAAALPGSVDWQQAGGVSPVYTQGNCNAAWAITDAEAVEGAVFASTGVLTPLSAQQIIDCSGLGSGCNLPAMPNQGFLFAYGALLVCAKWLHPGLVGSVLA
jgi:hypothetical protein